MLTSRLIPSLICFHGRPLLVPPRVSAARELTQMCMSDWVSLTISSSTPSTMLRGPRIVLAWLIAAWPHLDKDASFSTLISLCLGLFKCTSMWSSDWYAQSLQLWDNFRRELRSQALEADTPVFVPGLEPH